MAEQIFYDFVIDFLKRPKSDCVLRGRSTSRTYVSLATFCLFVFWILLERTMRHLDCTSIVNSSIKLGHTQEFWPEQTTEHLARCKWFSINHIRTSLKIVSDESDSSQIKNHQTKRRTWQHEPSELHSPRSVNSTVLRVKENLWLFWWHIIKICAFRMWNAVFEKLNETTLSPSTRDPRPKTTMKIMNAHNSTCWHTIWN